jgi:DNA-binding NarL/FixJ family response regulator
MAETRYIAIVDDHSMFRKGLAALINLFPNYEVLLDAGNGKELIRQLQPDNLPHILLLDIAMPEMDGYATAAWVKQQHPEIKILALSTMDGETAIIKMIKNGAKGYLMKDSEPAELKQAFDDVLAMGYYYNDVVSRKLAQSVFNNAEGKDSAISRMTGRELQFLQLACSEKTYKQIAAEMFVSQRTVDGYREALFQKLSISTRVGLAIYAIKNQLVTV